jgi:LAO/AO transport system kinase
MTDPHREKARLEAVDRIRAKVVEIQPSALAERIIAGDKGALAQAITLAESTNAAHQAAMKEIIRLCLPHTGKSIRIGITGIPGVGKSTFIEAFGLHVIQQNHTLAVLAIDPTSPFSHGSILGDKTRMEKLSVHPSAFIRPSPSSLNPGGVARHTREAIMLCEAAGFDVVIIETVGVGQGEIAVHGMTDFFLLLMLAGAGDQLQGIKRGIMELCDGMLITKCDGDNLNASSRAKAEYLSALHLFPPRESQWMPRVETISALQSQGMDKAWTMVEEHAQWMKSRGLFDLHRKAQDVQWMHESVRNEMFARMLGSDSMKREITLWEERVSAGTASPFEAAEYLVERALKETH